MHSNQPARIPTTQPQHAQTPAAAAPAAAAAAPARAQAQTTFDRFALIEPILRAVKEDGYTAPTPIQEQAIPHVLAGHDVLGCAQTGTGKTLAFAAPILQRLTQNAAPAVQGRTPIRVLVLAPTRELASQIDESFRAYGRHLRHGSTVIFGGVGQYPQEQALRRGPAIVVACPGRLLDLMGQGHVRLDKLEVLVLDEADRMLDMGFIHDIRKILAKVPAQRQTLFFSATMPREIRQLADSILKNPIEVAVAPESTTAETVQQAVYMVSKMDKPSLLAHLLAAKDVRRALVFTRTKHGADKVARRLEQSSIGAEAIHGNKSQNARIRALANFKSGKTRVLVASDIASRGIDVDGITHVVNFELPNEPETYVHRIGRTGRAGAAGIAWSFCDHEERAFLRDIERTIGKPVPVEREHPYAGNAPRPSEPQQFQDRGQRQGGGQRSFGGGRQGGGHRGQQRSFGGQRQGGGHGDQRRQHGDGQRLHAPRGDAQGQPRQDAQPQPAAPANGQPQRRDDQRRGGNAGGSPIRW